MTNSPESQPIEQAPEVPDFVPTEQTRFLKRKEVKNKPDESNKEVFMLGFAQKDIDAGYVNPEVPIKNS